MGIEMSKGHNTSTSPISNAGELREAFLAGHQGRFFYLKLRI